MKKILALVLALVLVLSLGVVAFADHVGGAAGDPVVQPTGTDATTDNEHDFTADTPVGVGDNAWKWDIYQEDKAEYCRIKVDFLYDKDIVIYVCPTCVAETLGEAADEVAKYADWEIYETVANLEWDFDKNAFEISHSDNFDASCDEVEDVTIGGSKHDVYAITINPIDDYGTEVVRGTLSFKMIDYYSNTAAKFVSAPLYIDFFHTDVSEDDVYDIAGEKGALILDQDGVPYDNEFDAGEHVAPHDGGANVYDTIYVRAKAYSDIISKESFDEGIGKSLKVTDIDKSWELQIAKLAKYQPSVNFTTDDAVAAAVEDYFSDAKFQAVNFLTPGDGIIYKSASKLLITPDAEALGMKGEETIYAYKYVNGVLEYQDAFSFNFYSGADARPYIELAAGESLGSYYLSDSDLRPVEPAAEENPNTGANDVVGVAVALAVVSLVAAAAVSLKK